MPRGEDKDDSEPRYRVQQRSKNDQKAPGAQNSTTWLIGRPFVENRADNK